jgi:hypothetical protein
MRIRDPGWKKFLSGIRDSGWKKVGSGIHIRICNTACPCVLKSCDWLQKPCFEPGGRHRPGAGDDDQHGRGGGGQKVQATHRANYRGNLLVYFFSYSHIGE